jgi:hypothetical protein
MHGESQSFSKDPKMNRNQHLTDWWFGTFLIFPFHFLGCHLPIDELHHFSRWFGGTTNQMTPRALPFEPKT